jgi:hypothetical protein
MPTTPDNICLQSLAEAAQLGITSGSRSRTTEPALTSDGGTSPVPQAFSSTAKKARGRYSLAALEDTLDWMHDTGEHFLGSYQMNSGLDRCEGGQGLVQFCHRLHRKEEFAIKCAACVRFVASDVHCKLAMSERVAAQAWCHATRPAILGNKSNCKPRS